MYRKLENFKQNSFLKYLNIKIQNWKEIYKLVALRSINVQSLYCPAMISLLPAAMQHMSRSDAEPNARSQCLVLSKLATHFLLHRNDESLSKTENDNRLNTEPNLWSVAWQPDHWQLTTTSLCFICTFYMQLIEFTINSFVPLYYDIHEMTLAVKHF